MGFHSSSDPQKVRFRSFPDRLGLVPNWTKPELCCGVKYCDFNQEKCWQATNQVSDIYNNALKPNIDEILDDIEDWLVKGIKYRPILSHSIYMVGRKRTKANPVIFFCCDDLSCREKALETVKSSGLLKEHPTIRLRHIPFAPESKAQPVFLARTPDYLLQDGERKGLFRRVIFNPRKATANGVQVTILGNAEHPLPANVTVGCFISLQGKIYGLTAAHGLYDDNKHNLLDPSRSQSPKDFTFEPVGNYESDESSSVSSDEDNESYRMYSSSQFSPAISPQANQQANDFQMSSSYDFQNSNNSSGDDQTVFGYVTSTSVVEDSLGSDWALIEVTYSRFQSVNSFFTGNTRSHTVGPLPQKISLFTDTGDYGQLRGVIYALPSDIPRSRIIVLAAQGTRHGTISATKVSMMFPGGSNMQEVWSVYVDRPMEKGDCGSVVVDPRSGNVYGHIVAGVPGTGSVYIIPAYQTQASIMQKLGEQFTFTTTEEYRRWFGLQLTPNRASSTLEISNSSAMPDNDIDVEKGGTGTPEPSAQLDGPASRAILNPPEPPTTSVAPTTPIPQTGNPAASRLRTNISRHGGNSFDNIHSGGGGYDGVFGRPNMISSSPYIAQSSRASDILSTTAVIAGTVPSSYQTSRESSSLSRARINAFLSDNTDSPSGARNTSQRMDGSTSQRKDESTRQAAQFLDDWDKNFSQAGARAITESPSQNSQDSSF